MSPELRRVLDEAESVARSGDGYAIRCPLHDDQTASLLVGDHEGQVRATCQAGCDWREVRRALRLDRDQRRSRRREIDETYPYLDQDGRLLFEVVRYVGKDFRQRRPDGNGGWIWKLKGVRRVLYRLPKVLQAVAAGERVYLVEGEKDVHSLERVGLVATTVAGGADKPWRDDYTKALAGAKDVVVLPDNDDPGRKHARSIAEKLAGRVPVRVLKLPNLPAKGDVSDWLRAGGTREDLEHLADLAPEAGGDQPAPSPPKPSHADLLIALAAAKVELWHDEDRIAYATFAGRRETHRVRSKPFRLWLTGEFYAEHAKSPGGQAVTNALDVLEAQAIFRGAQREAHVRVAHREGRVYVDLVDADWTVIEVTPEGWAVCDEPPVRFRRARGMRALPMPKAGGSLDELRELVNVPDDRDWNLTRGWLVGAFGPGPFVVLVVQGEQGSAKSTLSRMLRSLVDPSKVPLRSAPRGDERDLAIAASNGWVIGYDNLSGIPAWLSDALCRVATGGGFGTRQLYSDDEEALFDFTRPILVNGIDGVVSRSDLVERASILLLPRIPEEERRDERELLDSFEQMRPRLLGAILDAVACALRRRDGVDLDRRPRMADAATWVEAAGPALGLEPGDYVAALGGNQADAVSAALDEDPVGSLVRDLVVSNEGWSGTATQLLEEIGQRAGHPKPDRWPKGAKALSNWLTRLAPALRSADIDVSRDRGPGPKRERILVFRVDGRTQGGDGSEDACVHPNPSSDNGHGRYGRYGRSEADLYSSGVSWP